MHPFVVGGMEPCVARDVNLFVARDRSCEVVEPEAEVLAGNVLEMNQTKCFGLLSRYHESGSPSSSARVCSGTLNRMVDSNGGVYSWLRVSETRPHHLSGCR